MIRIQHLGSSEWEIFREVRLKALHDTPDAFGSTLEKERVYIENDWRNRLERDDCITFIALSEEFNPVGIVVGAPYDSEAGLFAMWIDPNQRKKGIGSLLVDAIIGWAGENAFVELRLDVADDNQAAIALYEAKGFVKTGIRGSLPAPRDHIKEHQRMLTIKRR